MPLPSLDELRALPGLELLVNEPMARHTSFGIGGPAAILAVPHTPQALQRLLRVCHSCEHKPVVLGNGTNVLVRDGGVPGIVIKLAENLSTILREGSNIRAQSGASLARLCLLAADWGLGGLTFAAGIPGTVGGAVWMNAGAWEHEIGETVTHVLAYDFTGQEVLLTHADLHFAYRHSSLQDAELVIAEVLFALRPGDPHQLHAELCERIEQRCCKQPVSQPSAGSIFKRPDGDYAGRLVETVGGKGLRVGGAMISQKHAGFIVNTGGATARDVLELLEQIRQRVLENEGVLLEPEVRVIGEDA